MGTVIVLFETGRLLGTVMVSVETGPLLMPEGVNCRLQDAGCRTKKLSVFVSGQILLLRF